MMNKLEKFKKQLQKDRETFDYKFESAVLELTENILKRMGEIDINRAELAERLNITKSAVTRMLDGNTNFTLKRMLAVALALDCEKVDIAFPPRGFKTPDVFVSQAEGRFSDRDYKTDPFAHMTDLAVDGDKQFKVA